MGEAKPVYKRVLLKISGEALAGDKKTGIRFRYRGKRLQGSEEMCGSGRGGRHRRGRRQLLRGVMDGGGKIERTRADHMGMMATVMNCLALADVLEQQGVEVRVQTALEIRAVAETLYPPAGHPPSQQGPRGDHRLRQPAAPSSPRIPPRCSRPPR